MPDILGKFTKQTREILDYDVDYTNWFSNRTDTPTSYVVEAEPGITVVRSSRSGNVVKVVLTGGVSGTKYKITVLQTTSAGLLKEADWTVTVKDV